MTCPQRPNGPCNLALTDDWNVQNQNFPDPNPVIEDFHIQGDVDSLILTWTLPDPLGYSPAIMYKVHGSTDHYAPRIHADWSLDTYTITGLLPNTMYDIVMWPIYGTFQRGEPVYYNGFTNPLWHLDVDRVEHEGVQLLHKTEIVYF